MCVHTFGNSPSPAMASYGFRKTAFIGKEEFGEDVYDFVTRSFYVDDGLSSFSNVSTAIDLLKRCQEALMRGGRLRLNKISSNSCEVMQAFPSNDLAQGIKHRITLPTKCGPRIKPTIHRCVKCPKLRRKPEFQKMADLPIQRLSTASLFTYVRIDTFGPWTIVSRRTRGGLAHTKRWAFLFTCLTIRAIHIELVEDMSSSSFINAFRRFVSVRGDVKEIFSDRGTNFVGSKHNLQIDSINVEDGPVKQYLYNRGVTWAFQSLHPSHMGGVWERMLGVSRRFHAVGKCQQEPHSGSPSYSDV